MYKRQAASNEETEKMIDELQADADKLTQELASQGSSSSDSTYLGGQMAWPLPSVGLSNITSYFGYRIHPCLLYTSRSKEGSLASQMLELEESIESMQSLSLIHI